MLAVNLSAMTNLVDYQNLFIFKQLIQYAIITDSELVKLGQIAS